MAASASTLSWEDQIATFAVQLLTDPDLRVVEREGKLIIDASAAPDWQRTAEILVDEPSISDAMRERHASPWLDLPAKERERLLFELDSTLRNSVKRTVQKREGEWQVNFVSASLARLVTEWRGYDRLERLLVNADRSWTSKEVRNGSGSVRTRRDDGADISLSKGEGKPAELGRGPALSTNLAALASAYGQSHGR